MTKRTTAGTQRPDRRNAENHFILDLRHVKANTYQSREQSVIANLNAVGFGLFERLKGQEEKEPLWEMLTGSMPERRALAVGLIDQYEPNIKELADSIAASTLLHNVGSCPWMGRTPPKGITWCSECGAAWPVPTTTPGRSGNFR